MDRQIGIAVIMASCAFAALAANCQPQGSDPTPTPTLRPTAAPTAPPNKPPVADAGPDQTVTDADGSGDEPVQLDGSGCSDEDGTIVSYAWSETGVDIATGVDPTVTLAVGTHIILLVVTDDAGGSGSENVKIKVEEPLPTPTLLPGTPSPTDTPGPGTPSATPIPGTTPTETSTPGPGTPSATPTPTPTATQTPPPAATDTPTPTTTGTPDATPAETSEPTVEPTATAIPAATPSGETVTLDLGDGVTMVLLEISGGEFDMGTESTDYSWLEAAVQGLLRKDAAILIFSPLERLGDYERVLEGLGCTYKTAVIWHRTNGVVHVPAYKSSCEAIVYAIKGKPFFRRWETQKHFAAHNFIEGASCMGLERKRWAHPTQKPEYVVERLLHRHSQPGDWVLDPFMGVATVPAVCAKTDRNAVGIERDSDFFARALARLHEHPGSLTSLRVPHAVPVS